MAWGRGGVLGVALLFAAGALLVGCTGAPTEVTVTVTVTPTPTVDPTPTPVPTATPTQAPVVVPDPTLTPNAPAEPAEPLPPGPATDLGARPGATGSPTLNDAGELSTYTVVEGDSFFDIAQRFDVPQQQLLRMNPSIPDLGEAVYIGDVINIDWTRTL